MCKFGDDMCFQTQLPLIFAIQLDWQCCQLAQKKSQISVHIKDSLEQKTVIV